MAGDFKDQGELKEEIRSVLIPGNLVWGTGLYEGK